MPWAAYLHPSVLICDEVGYLTYGTDAANMLFHVVDDRHRKKRAMIFTTNKANNVSYSISYTLSTSRDDASSPGATEAESNLPQNVRNIFDESGEWAHSSFDHRHAAVADVTYEFRRGFRVNAVFSAQSGAPFAVNLGIDQANIGAGAAQRPDQLREPNLSPSDRTVEHWFDTSAFALPAPFTFGTAPRNSVIGPGYATLDLAVAKDWKIGREEFRIPLGSFSTR